MRPWLCEGILADEIGREGEKTRLDAKEKLLDLRDAAVERWLAFRARSGFFQVKVLLIASYVAVVVTTVLFAPPDPPDAIIDVLDVDFGLSKRVVIDVHNQALGDLRDVVVRVEGSDKDLNGKVQPGRWSVKLRRLDEGQTERIQANRLRDKRGRPPGDSLRVDTVTLTQDGEILWVHPPR